MYDAYGFDNKVTKYDIIYHYYIRGVNQPKGPTLQWVKTSLDAKICIT